MGFIFNNEYLMLTYF